VRLRRSASALAAAVLCGVASGCSGSHGHAQALVALGDSVPRGTNCDCRPYPELSADELKSQATNDAVAGATTSDVLAQVTSDAAVRDHLSPAKVVEIEVGANDVAYSSACGAVASCYTPRIPALEKNLGAIVASVRDVAKHKPLVVLLDYWSVWLGGQYAAAHGEAYVDAAAEVTTEVNAAIRRVASSTGSAYVDLRAAFKGPDYAYDETHYLSNDGDHPNAAGHAKIADAAVAVIDAAR
jgi:lysophospholipase L1-like esterase